MKKIISLVCAGFMLASPLGAFADTQPAMRFEDFKGDDDTLAVLPAGNTLGSFTFNYGKSGTDGARAAKTDRGISLELINKTQAYLSLRYNFKKPVTDSIKINLSMQLEDFNSGRTILLRSSASSSAYMAGYFEPNGSLQMFEKRVQDFKTRTGIWYDIEIKYNIETAYYTWSISSVDGEFSDSGYYLQRAANLRDINILLFGYSGRKDTSHTIYDDMAVNVTAPHYPDACANYGFEGLDSMPEELMADGAADINENGIVLPGDLPQKSGFTYSYPHDYYGQYRFDFSVLPKGSESFFALNGEKTIELKDEKIYILGEEKGSYKDGEILALKAETDTVKKTVSVLNGEPVLAEASLPASCIPMKNAGIYTEGSGEGETIVKTFAINQNEGLYISGLTPDPEIFAIVPGEVCVSFSNPIAECGTYKSDGKEINAVLTDEKQVALSLSDFEYGKTYAVNVSGVRDVLGNTYDGKFNVIVKNRYDLSDISISSEDSKVKASVSGAVYDGSEKKFTIALAVFDGETNELLFLMAEENVLDGSMTEYSVSAPISEGNYCESYIWDSIPEMNPMKNRVFFGTEPLKDTEKRTESFHEDMDTGIVTVSGAGITGGTTTALILKPGKTAEDIKDGASLAENIVFIKQFDKAEKDVFAFYPGETGGKYGMLIVKDGKSTFKADCFSYVSPKRIKSALECVNAAELNIKTAAEEYKDVFAGDISEINLMNDDEYKFLTEYVVSSRAKLEDEKFKSIEEFNTVFLKACAYTKLEFAKDGSDIKELFEKYADQIGCKNFEAYKTFAEQNEKVKENVYADIAKKLKDEELQKLFNERTVLRAVEGTKNQTNITAIIKDNNVFLKFDLADYEKLKNKVPVNSSLSGKMFETVSDFYDEFSALVKKQKKAESGTSSGNSSSSGSGGGNTTKIELAGKNGNDTSKTNTEFTDLDGFDWAREAIYALCEKDIIKGRSGKTFAPGDKITREEFTKLALLAFSDYDEKAESSFDDVNKKAWYYGYVSSAFKNGIVLGRNEKIFGIGDNVTRQDMAVIIFRAAQLKASEKTADFSDFEKISDYAKEAVSALYSAKVLSGTGNGNFEPVKLATRAEAAKMIYEALKIGGDGK